MEKVATVLGLVAVLMGGCARQPTRVLIEDSGDENVESVLAGIDWLESQVGCSLFERVAVGGGSRDWRGRLPPRGTITVQFVGEGHGKLDGKHGTADHGIRHRRGEATRCRIYLSQPNKWLAAHELGHCLGLKHSDEYSFMHPHSGVEFLSTHHEHLQALCLD